MQLPEKEDMPSKKRRPLFKHSDKKIESKVTSSHDNSDNYGKPVKRRKRHSVTPPCNPPTSTPKHTMTTQTPEPENNTLKSTHHSVEPLPICADSSVVNQHMKGSSSSGTSHSNSSIVEEAEAVQHISQEMIDDALFGAELSKAAVMSDTTISTSDQHTSDTDGCGQRANYHMTGEIQYLSDRASSQVVATSNACPIESSNQIQTTKDLKQAEPNAVQNEIDNLENDDLLFGLCPEDLSFSFSNSSFQDYTKSTNLTETLPQQDGLSPQTLFKQGQHPHSDSVPHNPTVEIDVCSKKSVDKVDTFYGLPIKVKECLKEHRGITQLYEWQDTCLHLPSVSNGTNLIYSLPTSGGKTLVAEILILKQLLLNNKDVLLILPFVSIVQEKVRQLTPFSTTLEFAIEEYAASKGRLPPRQRHKKRVIYIATIEKANGLVNSLIELGRIQSLGLVVIDELHMLGDGSVRGATLECCLAKVQYRSKHTQLVGMSATLSNISEIATFLKAQVFSSDFRPVELVEHVKVGRCVYSVMLEGRVVNFDPVRDIPDSTHSQLDPDQLTSLVLEVIPQSSCLVFCPTKKNCQNVALLLTKTLPRSLKQVQQPGKCQLLRLLTLEASGVCPILSQTIPYGLAYHHSGLTADERRVIEEGYLEGVLCLIACTSTLAAGVNLPAKRVILRSPYVGTQFISRSQYKQMVGRAGRSGLCDKGDSILILNSKDKQKVVSLLSGPYESCHSSLLTGNGEALLSLVLNLIGLKLVHCYSDLQTFLQSTLLHVQHDRTKLDNYCQDSVTKLVAMGYININTEEIHGNGVYTITSLGRATFKGCLAIDQAHQIYDELKRGQQHLVLSSDLHLLFLTTPIDLCTSIQPNWMVYFEVLTGLCVDEMAVTELLGIKPSYLAARATGSAKGNMLPETLNLYHRFYLTLILHSLLKLTSSEAVWKVADRFHCSRGFLQSIMNSTASHASCLVHFTAELPELWSLHLLLPAINKKLAYSSNLELVPLMEISGVKQGRARQLVSAGITTPHQLANSDPHDLCDKIENIFPKNAKRLIQSAKALLADQVEALMEEAEELMTLAPPQ